MKGKRIFQIFITSCLGLALINEIFHIVRYFRRWPFREIQPMVAVAFLLFVVWLSTVIFSTVLNVKILKKHKTIVKEGRPEFNSTWQFIVLLITIACFLLGLASPSFTATTRDQHGNVFFEIDFGDWIYPIGAEGIAFFYAIVLVCYAFMALVNSSWVKSDNTIPSLLRTKFNKRLVNSHILFGVMTLACGLIYGVFVTRSMIGVILYLQNMTEEMYETIAVWDTVLDFVRRYFYSIVIVTYGFWVFRDGRKVEKSLVDHR